MQIRCHTFRALLSTSVGAIAVVAGSAQGAIIAAPGPLGLDVMMGAPLMPVPADGMPVGTIYGHPPTFTPGIPLPTPIGLMGFGPSHERLTPGTPGSSGAFHALAAPGPIAGSTVYAPTGATAIDLFISAVPGVAHSFEVTAIGTATTTTIILPGVVGPTYMGFGAFGETIVALSIVKLPFPSPTVTTWVVDDIRVLPAPGALPAVIAGFVLAARRRRRLD